MSLGERVVVLLVLLSATFVTVTVFMQEQSVPGLAKETKQHVGASNTIPTFPPVSNPHEYNILVLGADSLRSDFGPFLDATSPSSKPLYTPNLDKLASQSLVLTRAYTQYPLCGPSRAAFFTGRRPRSTGVYGNDAAWPNFTSMARLFRMYGYRTIATRKTFEYDPRDWSQPFSTDAHVAHHHFYRLGHAWLPINGSYNYSLGDEITTKHACAVLRNHAAASDGKPLFLAVGFRKPHAPFVFPERYLDHYPRHSIELPEDLYAFLNKPSVSPGFLPDKKYREFTELRKSNSENTTTMSRLMLELRRAYGSTVTYIDSLYGQILNTLAELGLASSTIVLFWSDHGMMLGEKRFWGKYEHYDLCNRIPLMIRIPGRTEGGLIRSQLVELVDVFPTLVEAVGLRGFPACFLDHSEADGCWEGSSLLPLLSRDTVKWKGSVFWQTGRSRFSIRTAYHRYTVHVDTNNSSAPARPWHLSDFRRDPRETRNFLGDPELGEIQGELHRKLLVGWRAALPESKL